MSRYHLNLNSDDFAYCCGIAEVSLESLTDELDNFEDEELSEITPLKFAEDLLENLDVAAFVFTDNNRKGFDHKLLTNIVEPISIGKNPNSGNNLYMWVIRKIDLTNFIKEEKSKLKLDKARIKSMKAVNLKMAKRTKKK